MLTGAPSDYLIIWTELVRDCSNKKLTYETDALPSFAEVIRYFEPYLGVSILGLREDSLALTIGWQKSHAVPPAARSKSIPSWTWLSLCSNTSLIEYVLAEYGWEDMKSELLLISWNAEWAGKALTSNLLSTHLHVSSRSRVVPWPSYILVRRYEPSEKWVIFAEIDTAETVKNDTEVVLLLLYLLNPSTEYIIVLVKA